MDLRNSRERGVQFLNISFWNSSSQQIKEPQKGKAIVTPTLGKGSNFEEEVIDNALR